MSEPLTPEEEAELRAMLLTDRLSLLKYATTVRGMIRRLLATLDAARLSNDRGADAREALTNITFAQRHLLGDSDVSRDDASAALIEASRILHAQGVVQSVPALDAETLARALVKATREQAGEPDGEGWPGYVYFGKPRDVSVVLVVRELVEAIIREYEALRDAEVKA